MARYRQDFLSGVATVTTTTGLVLTGTGFPNGTIPVGSYMAITLNPGYYGSTSSPEILYIGNGTTSTSAVVAARGVEGTTAITGTNIPWVAGPTVFDFDMTNLTSTGTVTVNNGLSVTGAINATGGINSSSLSNVSAAGTSQGTATAITTQYTVVSGGTNSLGNGSSGAGVVLPSISTTGQKATIDNSTNNWLLIYPATGQSIDAAGTNAAVWVTPSGYWQGYAETSTSWATVIPSLNADSTGTVNVSYGNGQVSFGIPTSLKIPGNLTVSGGTTVLGSLGVAGNFNANGTSVVFPSGSLQVAGSITTSGTLQATTITGTTVNVGGNLTVSGVSITGVPRARMSAAAQTIIAPSGAYTQVANMLASASGGVTYGFLSGGFTFSSNALIVPLTGYYQINASVGFNNNTGDPTIAGVYGIQVDYAASPSYVGAAAYLVNASTAGVYGQVPETIVCSDIVYCVAGTTLTLFAYSPSTVNQAVGAVAGPETTYLSAYYIGS